MGWGGGLGMRMGQKQGRWSCHQKIINYVHKGLSWKRGEGVCVWGGGGVRFRGGEGRGGGGGAVS